MARIEDGNWGIALGQLLPGENVAPDTSSYQAIVDTWRGPGDPPSEQDLRDAFAAWEAAQPVEPDEALADAIEAATTLAELKDALLGRLTPDQKGRVGSRPT